jgi:hypothetical protein
MRAALASLVGVALLGVALTADGAEPELSRPTFPDDLASRGLADTMPPLRLTWPMPLAFSFTGHESVAYADGPLSTFRAEAIWARRGPFALESFASAERSVELDCRLSCQPVLERSFGIEARLDLGSMGALRDTHVFLRGVAVALPWRRSMKLDLGYGGSFH